MPSSDAEAFAPLGGPSASDPFRPLGTARPAPVDDATLPAPDPIASAFEAGRALGRAQANAEQVVLARDLERALASIAAWRAELRTRYTDTLLALALETARKIVGDELDARPERWAGIVAAAIGRLVDRDRVTVRVAPRLAALLRAHGTDAPADGAEVRIVEDATLDADACRIESRSGDVECGVGAQLAAAAEALGATPR
jgi:flagellar biosynthesis/type III secretory pathway protein FliH